MPVAKQRSISVHLPTALDLGTVVPPRWVPYAELVTGAVVYQRFVHHVTASDFVPFSYEFSRRVVPHRTRRPILSALTNSGVLECDGTYWFDPRRESAGKAYCFRLGAPYRDLPLKKRPITHPEVIRKMRVSLEAERAAIKNPTHKALRHWHDRVEITPDAVYGVEIPLDLMIDGERRFTVDDMGRVHTNITNLPRGCRQFIRIAGRDLWSVDVRNSQPLILSQVLLSQPNGGAPHPTGEVERREKGEAPPSVTHCDSFCLNEFRNHCLDGTIYESIASFIAFLRGEPIDRDEVKKKFLAVIYGRAEHMRTQTGEAIRSLYPDVHDACERYSLIGTKSWLPREMQRLESSVMILGVAGRLVREHPRIPVLTVHDSILVPEEHIPTVQRLIAEEWQASFGIMPRTKTTLWTGPPETTTEEFRP